MIEHERTAALVIASTEERRMVALKAELEMMDHSAILTEAKSYSESFWGKDEDFHTFMMWCNDDGFAVGVREEAMELAEKHGCQLALAEFVGGDYANDVTTVDSAVEGEKVYGLGDAFYLDAKVTVSQAF